MLQDRANSTCLEQADFGSTPEGEAVTLFTLRSPGGTEVRLMTLGGAVLSITTPDRNGQQDDVVLGFESLDEYWNDWQYMGVLVGRYANRIAGARFSLAGREYPITCNDGENQLHGGRGFHRVVWQVVDTFQRTDAAGVVLRHTSPAGADGYPGTLQVTVTCTLTQNGELCFDYEATTDETTHVNLTHHGYFNLAGQGTGTILDHELTLNAAHFTPVDGALIPTGEIREVAGTPFDFRLPQKIGARIQDDDQLRLAGGYDHNFVLNSAPDAAPRLAARLHAPASGRALEVFTTEPGIQVYTGNSLTERAGKQGRKYGPFGGIALETQHFPDSPNRPHFPSTMLTPEAVFRSRTVYRFLMV